MASKKKSSRSRSRRSSKGKRRQNRPIRRPELTPDQQLDILGGFLLAVALITLLSLLSREQGTLTRWWLETVRKAVGWGLYAVPLLLGAPGLWLLLRRFGDRLPQVRMEQLIGAAIAFLLALLVLHAVAFYLLWEEGDLYAPARAGAGGGFLGALLLDWGLRGLGKAGIVVLVVMGFLIAFVLLTGLSPADLLAWWREQRRKRDEIVVHQPHLIPPEEEPPSPVKRPPIVLGEGAEETEPKRRPTSAARPKKAVPRKEKASAEEPVVVQMEAQLPLGTEWRLPRVADILEVGSEQQFDDDLLRKQARIIEETLLSLGAPAKVMETNRGPVVTQFGVEPLFITTRSGKRTKVKVSKIAALADDLALALSARAIRIEAPIPGKGLVGIEVPNERPALVSLRDVMESEAFTRLKGTLRMALGQDVSGQAVAADLRKMPHLLIAGTTGSGKSICINAIISSFLLQNSPKTLRLLMVDPKRVELTQYNGIPHLLAPVIVDVEKVVPALRWVMREMDGRYRRFAQRGARNIEDYNRRAEKAGEERLPYIVVVVDELADLMIQSPEETERVITRLAQMARATGIHIIIATQRPSVDVVTGLIKANFPARIAFAVASAVDSRVILDIPGAERLLGRGDMLFLPPDVGQPLRLQGTYVSNAEIDRLIDYWRKAAAPGSNAYEAARAEAPAGLEKAIAQPSLFPDFEDERLAKELEDPLLPTAVEVLLAENRASISLLQRRLRIGYTRSARLIDLMTERGIVTAQAEHGLSRGVNRTAAEAFLRSLRGEPSEEAGEVAE